MTDSPLTIYQAMARILADVNFIGKDRKADMGNAGRYNFRGIDDCYNALHSSFAKYKVFIIPEILESKFEIQEKEKTYNGVVSKSYSYSAILTIKFTFVSEDGSSISAIGIGHALDQSDKATNKAQSSALKYCLMQTFLIPTEEPKDVEEQNISVSKPASKSTALPAKKTDAIDKAREALRDLMTELDWPQDKKTEWAKSINPLPYAQWDLKSWELGVVKAQSELDKLATAIPY